MYRRDIGAAIPSADSQILASPAAASMPRIGFGLPAADREPIPASCCVSICATSSNADAATLNGWLKEPMQCGADSALSSADAIADIDAHIRGYRRQRAARQPPNIALDSGTGSPSDRSRGKTRQYAWPRIPDILNNLGSIMPGPPVSLNRLRCIALAPADHFRVCIRRQKPRLGIHSMPAPASSRRLRIAAAGGPPPRWQPNPGPIPVISAGVTGRRPENPVIALKKGRDRPGQTPRDPDLAAPWPSGS